MTSIKAKSYGLKAIGRTLAWGLLLAVSIRPLAAEDKSISAKVGRGLTTSIRLDAQGGLHLVYEGPDSKVYYSFRPAGSDKWFTIVALESTHVTRVYPRVAVDGSGNPHICVAMGELQYISFRDDKWITQVIDPGSGTISYHCSIAIAADGTPHMSWYHEFLPGGKQFTHLRHADIEDGMWVVRSVDWWNFRQVEFHGARLQGFPAFVLRANSLTRW